ncbi:MAG: sensor histidine kinase, partial [Bdellovibrio sp.]
FLPPNLGGEIYGEVIFVYVGLALMVIMFVFFNIYSLQEKFSCLREAFLKISKQQNLESFPLSIRKDEPLLEAIESIQKKNVGTVSYPEADFSISKYRSMLARFSQGLTVSLKAPLTSILGQIQIIQSKLTDFTLKPHCESIERDARECRKVLDHLSQYFDKAPRNMEVSSVKEMLQSVFVKKEGVFKKQKIKYQEDVKEDLVVYVNKAEMIQALEFIIDNAIEALDQVSRREIFVKSFCKESGIVLQIQDSGPGIESQSWEKVFQPFYTTKEKESHPGLGLSAAQSIISKFKGHIKVFSEAKGGTFVEIWLPEVKAFEKEAELHSLSKDNHYKRTGDEEVSEGAIEGARGEVAKS